MHVIMSGDALGPRGTRNNRLVVTHHLDARIVHRPAYVRAYRTAGDCDGLRYRQGDGAAAPPAGGPPLPLCAPGRPHRARRLRGAAQVRARAQPLPWGALSPACVAGRAGGAGMWAGGAVLWCAYAGLPRHCSLSSSSHAPPAGPRCSSRCPRIPPRALTLQNGPRLLSAVPPLLGGMDGPRLHALSRAPTTWARLQPRELRGTCGGKGKGCQGKRFRRPSAALTAAEPPASGLRVTPRPVDVLSAMGWQGVGQRG